MSEVGNVVSAYLVTPICSSVYLDIPIDITGLKKANIDYAKDSALREK